MEGKGWSNVNPKRSLKRQRTGKSEIAPDKRQEHDIMTNETGSQRSEQKEEDKTMEYEQDPQWVEEVNKAQQLRKEDKGQQNYSEGLTQSPLNRQMEANPFKMGTHLDAKQNQPEASGKKGNKRRKRRSRNSRASRKNVREPSTTMLGREERMATVQRNSREEGRNQEK